MFLFSTMGLIPVFYLNRNMAKAQMKKEIRMGKHDADAIPINLKINKVKWEKPGKEFWLNNEIYDIIKCIDEDQGIYLCINDRNEEKIMKGLKQLIMKGEFNHNTLTHLLIKLINSEKILSVFCFSWLNEFSVHDYSGFIVEDHVPVNLEVLSPPPDNL